MVFRMAPVRCEDCDEEFHTTEEVDHEHVDEIVVEEVEDGPPKISHGADRRDRYRCPKCGKILGVN